MVSKKLSLIFVLAISILAVYFVLAACGAPTDLHFEQNTTLNYDKEGTFTVNWTAGAGDDASNYSVYISVDGGTSFYKKDINNSETGYSFDNQTEANYTFRIGAVNATVNETNSSSDISMFVDPTAPTISLPVYTNETLKKSTENLILNISVTDSSSGLTGSACLVNVNGTNQTLSLAASGWCNSTGVKLTNLDDGTHIIKVYVNDTINNWGLNNDYVVKIDTTAPTVTLTESSSALYSLTITISVSESASCSVDRSGASISGSGTGQTLTETGLSCGTSYSYTVTCTDTAGNSGSSSATSFSTDLCGGGGGIPSFWTMTYVDNLDEVQEEAGYSKALKEKHRMKVTINDVYHYVGVIDLTSTTATINVSSVQQQAVFNIGDEKKFDVTDDGYYDLLVKLNGIEDNKADLTIKKIYEEIVVEGAEEDEEDEEAEDEEEKAEEKIRWWLWVVIAVIVVLILVGIKWGLMRRRK